MSEIVKSVSVEALCGRRDTILSEFKAILGHEVVGNVIAAFEAGTVTNKTALNCDALYAEIN